MFLPLHIASTPGRLFALDEFVTALFRFKRSEAVSRRSVENRFHFPWTAVTIAPTALKNHLGFSLLCGNLLFGLATHGCAAEATILGTAKMDR